MAKRGASNELTDRNWDQEEEPEEAGVFKAADDDTLKKRQIKTAKRRAPTEDGGGTAGAFKGFAGFGAKPSASPSAPVFNFGSTKGLPGLGASSNGEKPAGSGFTFGSLSKDAKTDSAAPKLGSDFKFTPVSSSASDSKTSGFGLGASPAPFSFGVKSTDSKETTKPLSSSISFGSTTTTDSKSETSPKKNGSSSSNPKYLAQLKGLNEGVAKWIKNHVDDNPYILLTPIFKDYEKYLEKIEKENPEKSESGATEDKKTDSDKPDSSSKSPASSDTKKDESSTKTSPFKFGVAAAPASLTSGFAFKPAGGATTATSGFSFKPADSTAGGTIASTPFSFATGGTTAAPASAEGEGGEEEYVPPKPESVEIKEDDALYSKRCKLFFQKEGTWTEKGVGNIYLKPLNDKTQLLIRADNTLGTVLLNIVLSSAIPTKRQGKNNVSLICTPNPPIDPKVDENKPASLLIRVKTSEDADELLAQLEKHKS